MIGWSGGDGHLTKLVFAVVVLVSVAFHGSRCEDGGPAVKTDDGPATKPDDGPATKPDDGRAAKPDDGPATKPDDGPATIAASESVPMEKATTVKYERRYDNVWGRGRGRGMGRGRGGRGRSGWSTAITGKYARRTKPFLDPFSVNSTFSFIKRNKTTRVPKTTVFTLNLRKAANVFRGAIALFQRIQHPLKDKLLGTYPPSKPPVPVYCSHDACLAAARRGSRHGAPSPTPADALPFGRPAGRSPVRVLIGPRTERNADVVRGPTAVGEGALIGPPPLHQRLGGRYGPPQLPPPPSPFLHYEAAENHHFESFGKQELGRPEEEPARPHAFLFNPLLYRSRLADPTRDRGCDRCVRPLLAPDDFILKSRKLSPSLLKLRRHWFRQQKHNTVKSGILRRLVSQERVFRPPPRYKAFADALFSSLFTKYFSGGSVTPFVLRSLVGALMRIAAARRKPLVIAPPPAPIPLLGYGKDERPSSGSGF